MEKKNKTLKIDFPAEAYAEIRKLADQRNMSVPEFIKYISLILAPTRFHFQKIKDTVSKNNIEEDLEKISQSLTQQKRSIELLQSSIYSAALTLESQIKKLKSETARELKKDIERIEYLSESRDSDD